MKAKELIVELSKLDPDLDVFCVQGIDIDDNEDLCSVNNISKIDHPLLCKTGAIKIS